MDWNVPPWWDRVNRGLVSLQVWHNKVPSPLEGCKSGAKISIKPFIGNGAVPFYNVCLKSSQMWGKTIKNQAIGWDLENSKKYTLETLRLDIASRKEVCFVIMLVVCQVFNPSCILSWQGNKTEIEPKPLRRKNLRHELQWWKIVVILDKEVTFPLFDKTYSLDILFSVLENKEIQHTLIFQPWFRKK